MGVADEKEKVVKRVSEVQRIEVIRAISEQLDAEDKLVNDTPLNASIQRGLEQS